MESLWQSKIPETKYPTLKRDITTDVLVIGGGMAGILCAKALQLTGKDVVLVEAKQIGCGITAGTTAVLTAQHDMLYSDMIRSFGETSAKAYLHGNLDAVSEFRRLSQEIPCDFEDMPSIQYTAKNKSKMEYEAKIVQKLGFPASFQSTIPLRIPVSGAVIYPGMAQFHPLKFLNGAAKNLTIYENSRVLQLDGTTALLEQGCVRANKIIVATHFPFLNRKGLYFLKLYQRRSYVLALENAPDPGATLAELDGRGLYFRRYGDLLLLGGSDHRTGKHSEGFSYLRYYSGRHFPDSKQRYAWANQDCITLDGLPYVGHYSPNTPDIYVATGFNAWGMTNSMVAANLLRDMIVGKENPLESVLRPNRSMLHKQLFFNAVSSIADYVIPTTKRCPHLGCALRWNPYERSWDCPCHGSRFSDDGVLLDTPAQKNADLS